ncbi:hypothetical protein [Antarctobacter sp.]|uniref:hypothetical protein n=1 Tax=Antarctobacter sp. TaxID=1872577 RepID=UPI003A93C027
MKADLSIFAHLWQYDLAFPVERKIRVAVLFRSIVCSATGVMNSLMNGLVARRRARTDRSQRVARQKTRPGFDILTKPLQDVRLCIALILQRSTFLLSSFRGSWSQTEATPRMDIN